MQKEALEIRRISHFRVNQGKRSEPAPLFADLNGGDTSNSKTGFEKKFPAYKSTAQEKSLKIRHRQTRKKSQAAKRKGNVENS